MNIKVELYRKVVHVSSSLIAFSVCYFDKSIYVPALIILTFTMISLDILRLNSIKFSTFYYKYFNIFTREMERNKITGASFVFAGSLLTVLIFEKEIAFWGLLIMSISDSFAAVIGVLFGKTKLFSKSLEGSLAYFCSAFVILSFSRLGLIEIFLVSLVSTFAELFSTYKYNDNVIIPLTTSAAIYIFKML